MRAMSFDSNNGVEARSAAHLPGSNAYDIATRAGVGGVAVASSGVNPLLI